MTDIYDIKTLLFGFIFSTSYGFILFFLLFLIGFFYLLNYFFKDKEKDFINLKQKIYIEYNFLEKLNYLKNNLNTLPREVFYKELSFFIRNLIYKEYKDLNIFYMTFDEIESKFDYKKINLFKEVYFLEFDFKKDDNLLIRENIINKIVDN